MKDHASVIAGELTLKVEKVTAAMALLDQGATIPFVARYRKEATGSMDEVVIQTIRDRLSALRQLDARREAILKSLRQRDLLDDVLERRLLAATSLTKVEDLYLPFRPKRRTRAAIARERGLEPLAELVYRTDIRPVDVASFVNPQDGVADETMAWDGAMDIIAEWISEDPDLRDDQRRLWARSAVLESRVIPKKKDEAVKFRDYWDWSEPLHRTPSHRILAVLRGMREGFLTVHARPPESHALERLVSRVLGGSPRKGPLTSKLRDAATDAYHRLLTPSLETETLSVAKERADREAISIFARNLRELLLGAPLGAKPLIAVDPGFRTGCKVVALDGQGALLENTTIYPGERQRTQAESTVREICARRRPQAIAIGNGTGGRETEAFLRDLALDIPIVMVDESGASVYSASALAREELPAQDITVRGAVSIGRRLQDPLAELVKIDPKAIGVGQYQHDVDQGALQASVDDVVTSCVNAVGVEVNSASARLLTYVSGLGPQVAANIVRLRDERGPFRSRDELRNVPRLGARTFEQAAGFLRIRDGHPLDAGAVHPERYGLVEQMARDAGCTLAELLADPQRRVRVQLTRYVTEAVAMPTLQDIMNELERPGRDPRPVFESFTFDESIHSIQDVQPGMLLPGIVTNVTAFGAFVDIGVHQDGLVHISRMSDHFVADPSEVVRARQKVMVRVLETDVDRRRISLSLEAPSGPVP